MIDSYYELIVQHVSKLSQENFRVSLKWNCVKFEVYKVEVDSAIYNALHMRGFCTLQATTSLMYLCITSTRKQLKCVVCHWCQYNALVDWHLIFTLFLSKFDDS